MINNNINLDIYVQIKNVNVCLEYKHSEGGLVDYAAVILTPLVSLFF